MSEDKEAAIATIALRQVRVSRTTGVGEKPKGTNLMNRLVPYLDLFARLSDEEIARVAMVPTEVATGLRQQVISVDRALERFSDLVPRLSDGELVRLTGATPKTVRFWRLCQPRWRTEQQEPPSDRWSVANEAEKLAGAAPAAAPVDSAAPLGHDSGISEPPRVASHDSSEIPAVGSEDSGVTTRDEDSQELTRSGSVAYSMPMAEREGGFGRQASARDSQPHRTVNTGPREVARDQSRPVRAASGPFSGYEPERGGEGVFIGLELPDPRSYA